MSSFVIAILVACWPVPEAPPGWACRSVSVLHPSEAACQRWSVGVVMALRGRESGRARANRADRHEIVKAECLPVTLPAGPET